MDKRLFSRDINDYIDTIASEQPLTGEILKEKEKTVVEKIRKLYKTAYSPNYQHSFKNLAKWTIAALNTPIDGVRRNSIMRLQVSLIDIDSRFFNNVKERLDKLPKVVNKYADAIVWHSTDREPSFEELNRLETEAVSALLDLKEVDYQRFRITFTDFGKVISRKSALIQDEKPENMSNLLLSLNRVLSNLKGMDNELYQSELSFYVSHNENIVNSKQQTKEEPKTNKKSLKEKAQVPHFKSLKLKDEKAPVLYKKLVDEGYLEDTGEGDFVYYFTGKGKQSQNKLKWRKEAVILSVLMSELCGKRVQWTILEDVFEGLNTDSMRSKLSQMEKASKKGTNYSLEEHKTMVREWLTKVNI